MDLVIDKMNCTGCGACALLCFQKAITMKRDEEGFFYPVIDNEKCNKCGLCQKRCPSIHYVEDKEQEKRIEVVATRSKNEEEREKSSSGGIFPLIARYVLDRKGCVVGAAFDSEYNVVHIVIDKKQDLKRIQGSKYAQSIPNNHYRIVRETLERGRLVLYSGLTCQVEGLYAYLGRRYDNLICVDLICMGVPSPMVWEKYIHRIVKKDEKICAINFKDKRNGWKDFSFVLETDKRVVVQDGRKNQFMQCMFKTYSIRPSCFNCVYKTCFRKSDFTISDCWGVEEFAEELNDNKGLSSVIIRTEKGIEIWNDLRTEVVFKPISLDDVVQGNPNICTKVKRQKNRAMFYFVFNRLSPKIAVRLFGKKPNNRIKVLLNYLSIRRGK